jgi:hypothetical protein
MTSMIQKVSMGVSTTAATTNQNCHVCAEFAVEAEAHVARKVYHDVSFPFCSVIHWVGDVCMSAGTALGIAGRVWAVQTCGCDIGS